MNRLQVGDECYVRIIGEFHRGEILSLVFTERIKRILNEQRDKYRLVYPFPCVKELAV